MRLDGAAPDQGPFEEVYDYVVIGSGAAGATAARVLADTGRSVAVLEEGPAVSTREFGDKAFPALRRLFRGMGAQTARGRAFIPVIQGRCLGGSTVINSAIVWRLPEDVWKPWADVHGLGDALPLRELHGCWDLIEKELGIAPTPPEAWGGVNRLMAEASRRLGVSAHPTRRNAPGCRGSARCLTGCPHGAKQSMLVSYLPYAEKKGAAILTSAKAERVVLEGGRSVSVEGRFLRGEGSPAARFCLRARRGVLVAASAIQTPGLLARSGVDSAHLGEHFQAHPGCGMVGLFERRVDMWTGATQGYDADEHRVAGRFKAETISFPPEILFPRMAGVGRRWLEGIAETPHAAIFAVQMRARAEGSVRDRFFGTDIRFDLDRLDMANMRRGLRFSAELLFAAGARAVLPSIHGLPERLTSPDQLRLIEAAPDDPRCYTMILSHLFGTARMSPRPSAGVVGLDFAVHGTKNLFVIDSSLFPTNTSVNPQHTIMGVAMLAARRVAERA